MPVKNATRGALPNFCSNMVFLATSAAVSLWMTPYLIGRLGLEVYGFVPLFVSAMAYMGLLTRVLASAVERYVALSYFKLDIGRANVYLSSGFWGLAAISLAVTAAAIALTPLLSGLLHVPAQYERQVTWLFLLVVGATIASAFTSLYGRSCFLLQKFYWLDVFSVLSKILQVVLLVAAFRYISESLVFVGLAALGAALFRLLSTALLDRFMLPELTIEYRAFNWKACRELLGMGADVMIWELGALLYLSADLIVIGMLLGSTATGQYGPIVQWVVLIRSLAVAVGRPFGPVVMELLAKENYASLIGHICTVTKLLGLIIGLPVFLIAGFSRPLLSLWLGDEFAELYKLMVLLILSQCIPYSLGFLFAVFKGLNKLRAPSVVTLAAGVANVILSVILIRYTGLGIYGAGIATAIVVLGKGALFNVLYLSRLLNCSASRMWLALGKGCLPSIAFAACVLWISRYLNIDNLWTLIAYGVAVSLLYCLVVFRAVMTKPERLLVLNVLKAHRFLSPRAIAVIAGG